MKERQLGLFRGKRQRGVAVDLSPSEFQLQCMVVDTLRRWATPGWFYCHYPAGEHRNPATGARLKRMGVFPGVADLLLFPPDGWGGKCCFLELKRHKGKLSAPQLEFAFWCKTNKYPFEMADNYNDAIEILKRWGAVQSSLRMSPNS